MKDLTRAIYLISAFILFFMIWCLFAIESVAFFMAITFFTTHSSNTRLQC